MQGMPCRTGPETLSGIVILGAGLAFSMTLVDIETYREQRRGGKGVVGMNTKEEDFVENVFTASTHDFILFFTGDGRVYWKKAYQIPEAGPP